jgi:hypothetical protein
LRSERNTAIGLLFLSLLAILHWRIFVTGPFPLGNDIVNEVLDNLYRPDTDFWRSPLIAFTKFISLAVHDPFNVFYARQFLLNGITIAIFALFLTRMGYSKIASLVCCMVLLSTVFTFFADSTQAAFLCALIGIVLSLKYQEQKWAPLAFIVSLLIACTMRREYAAPLLFYLCLLAMNRSSYFKTQNRNTRLALITSFGFLIPTLLIIIGSVTNRASVWFAFGQHFSVFYSESHPLGLNPWLQWEIIMKIVFPQSQSLHEAFMDNPQAMVWFISRKLLITTPSCLLRFLAIPDLVSGSKGLQLLTCACTTFPLWFTVATGVRLHWQQHKKIPLAIAALSITPIASIVITSPVPRHLLTLLPLMAYFAGFALREWTHKKIYLLHGITAASLFVSTILGLKRLNQNENLAGQPRIEQELHRLHDDLEKNNLTVSIFSTFYSERICRLSAFSHCENYDLSSLPVASLGKSFVTYATEHNITILVVDEQMQGMAQARHDVLFEQFVDEPTKFGYQKITTGDGPKLFVRRF